MTRTTVAILAAALLITAGTIIAITFARGYQFDPVTKQLTGTGILVATSDPNGAEVLIDGKLKTATNNSINLPPGTYDVLIQLDGYSSWEKRVTIKQEEVYKTNAFLFPKVPDLRPLTLTGSLNPTVAPDNSKIVYSIASASAEKNGIWIVDMGRSNIPAPLPNGGDFRQIYQETAHLSEEAKFLWSPDTKQVMVYTGSKMPAIATTSATPKTATTPTAPSQGGSSGLVYLMNTDQLNNSLVPLSQTQIDQTLADWNTLKSQRIAVQMSKLPVSLTAFLSSSAANIQFSPDETKLLYTATVSATMPSFLQTYLPGKNPTSETRKLTPGKVYVYDLKEDTNYQIDNCASGVKCSWFPSSRHILAFTNKEISVMEYDGSNKSTVYAGPFTDSIVYPWPNWSKIVISTSLNQIGENLYTINLR